MEQPVFFYLKHVTRKVWVRRNLLGQLVGSPEETDKTTARINLRNVANIFDRIDFLTLLPHLQEDRSVGSIPTIQQYKKSGQPLFAVPFIAKTIVLMNDKTVYFSEIERGNLKNTIIDLAEKELGRDEIVRMFTRPASADAIVSAPKAGTVVSATPSAIVELEHTYRSVIVHRKLRGNTIIVPAHDKTVSTSIDLAGVKDVLAYDEFRKFGRYWDNNTQSTLEFGRTQYSGWSDRKKEEIRGVPNVPVEDLWFVRMKDETVYVVKKEREPLRDKFHKAGDAVLGAPHIDALFDRPQSGSVVRGARIAVEI